MAARLIEVIETGLLRRGDGKDTPVRIITQYYSKNGTLLAEVDPSPDAELAVELAKARNSVKAYTTQLVTDQKKLAQRDALLLQIVSYLEHDIGVETPLIDQIKEELNESS